MCKPDRQGSFLRSRSRLTFCVDAEGLGYPDSSAVAPHIKPRLPVPVGFRRMALASAAVHSNKKTVVYYELPRPTDIRRPPLAAVRNGHLATLREMDRNRRREIITGVFRSAYLVRDEGVAGSNPATPTSFL